MPRWVFFLPDQDGGLNGVLFGVRKRGFMSKQMKYGQSSFDFGNTSDLLSSMSLSEFGNVRAVVLNKVCHDVNRNRRFHLLKNNPQHWVYEVIKGLIRELEIDNGAEILKKIEKTGLVPLEWTNARSLHYRRGVRRAQREASPVRVPISSPLESWNRGRRSKQKPVSDNRPTIPALSTTFASEVISEELPREPQSPPRSSNQKSKVKSGR